MSSIITKAFESWLVNRTLAGERATADKMIFALVPDQDESAEINPGEGIPPAGQIQYEAAITQTAALNSNAVVYSVVLDTTIGDWDYNWIGLVDSITGTLLMIVSLATQQKIKTQNGQQGNSLVRNLMMEFESAAEAAQITVTPETWQIDFSARMAGTDERQRIENTDIYGDGAFFDDAFLVTETGDTYSIQPGVGYVKGLRVVLDSATDLDIAVPCTVWAVACFDGTVTGAWTVQTAITIADDLADYIDNNRQYFVCAVAAIDEQGKITDMRPKGSLTEQEANDALASHEKSRNHPDGTLNEKGFVSLSSATDSESEEEAATPKAVKTAMDNASARLLTDNNLSDLPDYEKARDNLKAYPVTGGEIKGEAWSQNANNFRIISNNKGAFWRFDGSHYYLMFTDEGNQQGGYNSLRPLYASASTGNLSTGHDFTAGGHVHSGNGASRLATDGNIYGSCWDGYLNNWIISKLTGYVTSVRLGASSTYQERGNEERLAGGVMTSWQDAGSSNYWIRLRPLQYFLNGAWVTASYE